MPAVVLLIALVLLAVAVAAQLAFPRVAERRIRERLTQSGGEARVRIRAVPATRLLRNSGDRLEVRGRGLEIGLAGDGEGTAPAGLTALDGFADVDIELVGFRVGPFEVAAFVLARSGGESYAMASQATITGSELVRLGDARIRALPAGGLLSSLAEQAPLGSRPVTVSVEVELRSTEGRLEVASGGGSIAGYPAGPIAAAIAAAVARRLEIVP